MPPHPVPSKDKRPMFLPPKVYTFTSGVSHRRLDCFSCTLSSSVRSQQTYSQHRVCVCIWYMCVMCNVPEKMYFYKKPCVYIYISYIMYMCMCILHVYVYWKRGFQAPLLQRKRSPGVHRFATTAQHNSNQDRMHPMWKYIVYVYMYCICVCVMYT